MSFCVCLISPSITSSRFIHIGACILYITSAHSLSLFPSGSLTSSLFNQCFQSVGCFPRVTLKINIADSYIRIEKENIGVYCIISWEFVSVVFINTAVHISLKWFSSKMHSLLWAVVRERERSVQRLDFLIPSSASLYLSDIAWSHLHGPHSGYFFRLSSSH